jgi:hypothetical protein
LKNMAYNGKYKLHVKKFDNLFSSEYFSEAEDIHLSEKYTLHCSEYAGRIDNLNMRGNECILKYKCGKVIATWRSIDNNADFYKIILHRNGSEYLIFRQDLYGYSVMELPSGRIMQFYPEESLKGQETFIWTAADYNPLSNILAVSGCIWGAPGGIYLFTFDDPMNDSQQFIDLCEYIDGGYEDYDDVNFSCWINNDLHIKKFAIPACQWEDDIITSDNYLTWLSGNDK